MTASEAYEGNRSAGPAIPAAPPTPPEPRGAPPTAAPPAVPLAKRPAVQRKATAAALEAERKRPLPPDVAMVRYQKRVAMLEASSGQFVLRTSANAAVPYPATAAKRGHLIAGRIFLTAPDDTRHKVRAWEAGGRAPSELGQDDRSRSGDSGFDLGDDPISAIIALVLIVLFLLALPVMLFLWLRRRHRRVAVAKRVLAAGQAPGLRLAG